MERADVSVDFARARSPDFCFVARMALNATIIGNTILS
jgi:hypothetical protein